ncbi:tRNA guanosine(15) transglycosylase TgtA [Candidatus Bathyarchaeota archaeon]|nr:tRNA guanosine(15) transglycosylase TgtA [Candidatus Bathyarchaeota archaeon]
MTLELDNFEVQYKDLLGRIGELKTKSGVIETPHMFPVINPLIQPIAPEVIKKEFKINAVMVNAYLLKKNFGSEAVSRGVHKFINFDGIISTDSGAYQALIYGEIKASPEEMVEFQEAIKTDVAIILDVPTGYDENREKAEWTVKETLRRADLSLKIIKEKNILWIGPIQGGIHLDLVSLCAKEMSKKPFSIYALGSPTKIMEHYLFDKLIEMIMTAKMNLPLNKPLHLFGAGHPMIFALAVACGCDIFDSAAYAIFARKGKYLTESGTLDVNELEYFPCSCKACSNYNPKEFKLLSKNEQEKILAEHNLWICQEEIKRIKQAILNGRLWEFLEIKARAHPSVMEAFRKISKYKIFLEKHSPSIKRKGLFYFGDEGLSRPEIIRYKLRLEKNYIKPRKWSILVLFPTPKEKPFYRNWIVTKILKENYKAHICFYLTPFGLIPIELSDVYPISQMEVALPLGKEAIENSISEVEKYISRCNYSRILLILPESEDLEKFKNDCKKICKNKRVKFKSIKIKEILSEGDLKRILKSIKA